MEIIGIYCNNYYSLIPTKHLRDSRLSWQAKGLLTELFALSGEQFSVDDLTQFGTAEEVTSAIDELKSYGYIREVI